MPILHPRSGVRWALNLRSESHSRSRRPCSLLRKVWFGRHSGLVVSKSDSEASEGIFGLCRRLALPVSAPIASISAAEPLMVGWAFFVIWNWDFSHTKHISFGTDSKGLRDAQLQQTSFYSDFGNTFIGNAFISDNGEITTVPEAKTIVVTMLLLLGLSGRWMARSERNPPQSTE